MLNNLTGTPQYLSWLARMLRPHVGDTVLEIGAGIGNLPGRLMCRRLLYVAAEKDPLHLHALRNRFLRTPNVEVRRIDPEAPADFAGWTAASTRCSASTCSNTWKTRAPPSNPCAACLNPGGSLVVLAPQHPSLYGALDRTMGHKRRFEREQLEKLLAGAGFQVEKVVQPQQDRHAALVDLQQAAAAAGASTS